MAGTKGCETARFSESHKAGLSSDWRLQLASMKLELLVIPDQHAGVNTFPGLVHTDPTFDGSFLTVRAPASGVANFRGLTGGVYKARERIHPGNADPGLLATPT